MSNILGHPTYYYCYHPSDSRWNIKCWTCKCRTVGYNIIRKKRRTCLVFSPDIADKHATHLVGASYQYAVVWNRAEWWTSEHTRAVQSSVLTACTAISAPINASLFYENPSYCSSSEAEPHFCSSQRKSQIAWKCASGGDPPGSEALASSGILAAADIAGIILYASWLRPILGVQGRFSLDYWVERIVPPRQDLLLRSPRGM